MFNKTAAFEKFRNTLRRWPLFKAEEPLLVAVSGGVDSVVLLHLLLQLPDKLKPRLVVAHFNHRLRGRQSRQEADFVQKLCRQWKVPFHLGEALSWKSKSNVEDRARKMRYAFLKKTARRLKIKKILTAHQANDQLETFVIHWLQGAGLKGLSGIPLVREEEPFLFIRPLLLIPRPEIEEYARVAKLSHCVDPSNVSDDYLRNRVRKLVASLEAENPRLAERTALNALFLQADHTYLDKVVSELFASSVKCQRGKAACSIRKYLQWPPAVKYRILQKMAKKVTEDHYSLPAEAILKIDEILVRPGDSKEYHLPNGIGLIKGKNDLGINLRGKHR